jgi:hypothetical protein
MIEKGLQQLGALVGTRSDTRSSPASRPQFFTGDSVFTPPSASLWPVTPASTGDVRYELTDLGKHIAQLPLDPQLARLLLFGIALKCLNPIVTLVAALSHRDPCESPF